MARAKLRLTHLMSCTEEVGWLHKSWRLHKCWTKITPGLQQSVHSCTDSCDSNFEMTCLKKVQLCPFHRARHAAWVALEVGSAPGWLPCNTCRIACGVMCLAQGISCWLLWLAPQQTTAEWVIAVPAEPCSLLWVLSGGAAISDKQNLCPAGRKHPGIGS